MKLCSKCVGAKQIMIPKTNGKRGFEYVDCDLCETKGFISNELEEDYLLSINEDLIENYEP